MATGRIGTTPVLQVRWSKAPADGTTSLSGLDDNSVSLVYSVGYEAVYRNGVLLSRGNDYTATDGTTVTLIDATITGDIIEIFANQTIPLSDTYSQTVSDGKFINNTLTTTTGDIIYASGANTPARLAIGTSADVLTVSGGIPAWATPDGSYTLISTTALSGATVSLTSIPQTYRHLEVVFRDIVPSANDLLRLRINSVTSSVYSPLRPSNGAGIACDQSHLASTINVSASAIDSFNIYKFWDYANTTTYKALHYNATFLNSGTGTIQTQLAFAGIASNEAISALEFTFSGGATFSAGSVLLYGVK